MLKSLFDNEHQGAAAELGSLVLLKLYQRLGRAMPLAYGAAGGHAIVTAPKRPPPNTNSRI